MHASIHDPAFCGAHRNSAQDFTRQSPLNFPTTGLLILQKTTKSIQGHLHEQFTFLAAEDFSPGPTPSAFTQARAKVNPSAFVALNRQAVLEHFYHPANPQETWLGRRLLATDGSEVRLPPCPAVADYFGWTRPANQHGDCQAPYILGRASVLYDVNNRLVLDASLTRTALGERELAWGHLTHSRPGDVLLYDRGYCSFEWLAWLVAWARDFIVRVPRSHFGPSNELYAAGQPGVSRRVWLEAPAHLRAELAAAGLPLRLEVRLVTVALPGGELEVLATSLLDEAAYPIAALAEAYRRRWGVEGFYFVVKERLGLENFSGRTVESVQQDFAATVLITNLESVLCRPAQEQLRAAAGPEKPAPAQVNRAVSFNALKNAVFHLLGDARLPLETLLDRLTRLFMDNPVRPRPGRTTPRRKRSAHRSYNHQRYIKKQVF